MEISDLSFAEIITLIIGSGVAAALINGLVQLVQSQWKQRNEVKITNAEVDIKVSAEARELMDMYAKDNSRLRADLAQAHIDIARLKHEVEVLINFIRYDLGYDGMLPDDFGADDE